MFSFSSKSVSDESNEAASLMIIKVRKEAEDLSSDNIPHKSGDITERLAALTREMDEMPPMTAAAEQTDALEQVRPEPPKAQSNTTATSVRPADAPVRRMQSSVVPPQPRTRGWGRSEKPDDLLSYWATLRRGQRYPAHTELDTDLIGKSWPNSLLVNVDRNNGRMQLDYGFTQALRNAQGENGEHIGGQKKIDISPMVIDWVFAHCRDVAISGKPSHATEMFPSTAGENDIRLIALPLSNDQRQINYVLCHLQEL